MGFVGKNRKFNDQPFGYHQEIELEITTLTNLGSGLGRVAVLAHLLSGARTRGIEIQAALVERARARCAALGLTAVSFVHANAADAELDGSVFFLYAPCNGDLLARVVRRLEAVARRRPIVVAAVALELPDAPWLAARSTSRVALTLYESRHHSANTAR